MVGAKGNAAFVLETIASVTVQLPTAAGADAAQLLMELNLVVYCDCCYFQLCCCCYSPC